MGRPTARVDRRRRRPPSSTSFGSASNDCPAKFTAYARRVGAVPLIVATTCLLSILIQVAFRNTPHTSEEMIQKFHNDYVNARSMKQRRSLLQVRDGEQDAFDPENGVISENLWRRQLSVVRTENTLAVKRKEERMKLRADERRARFGEKHWAGRITKELSDEFGADSGRPMKRMAIIPRYTDKHHFEDCVGTTIEECQVIIDAYVQAHPEDFNNQTTLLMDIRKVRELTDESYYKVVLRTNIAGTHVYGIFDDGVVHYPWQWVVNNVPTEIGPWDCDDGGNMMSPAECCTLIQNDVTSMDDQGNFLACFVEEPVGGPNNPERQDRAIVVTDGAGKVVRAPIAH
ncbi:hypothetical protein THAOC_35946 [Thalassiosira oceanica]|uniref:Uncharacterized protein n=1 Tax=Thalassiosira oceanica TaxID=159749 RepID=K0R960_THAOC|nr:hypothetical protein THAOC_35946 [Thalassiosira oceanica]|mmetsp:Transcript_4848/g.10865  ORF Transcript_4848/g.10865 Transcript_4848/m.10865 type:complete len:344 (+) Transcript_4848:104-1135(+)|eukprot:EJK45436.1 hypothetical protein THAOC_35946 [Thalassiosira oceanica]